MNGWVQGTLKVGYVLTALRGYVENLSELRLRRLKHEGLLRCSPTNEAISEKNYLAEKCLLNCVFYFISLCSRKCSSTFLPIVIRNNYLTILLCELSLEE